MYSGHFFVSIPINVKVRILVKKLYEMLNFAFLTLYSCWASVSADTYPV